MTGVVPRIGIALCPVPPDVDDDRATEWRVEHAARLGVDVIAGDPRPIYGWDARRYDLGYLRHVRDVADAAGVEIEPNIGGIFGLAGPDPRAAREGSLASIRAAKIVGGPYVRAGYGQLEIRTSRFNSEIPLRDHLRQLVGSLKEAANLAEDEGVVIAVENHVDFTGRELAWVLEQVDSPCVRAALDTGNGFTVFADPDDDMAALAPLAVMCHLKDTRVVMHGDPGQVPYLPVGCVIGDGHVDIGKAIRLLLGESERGATMPLMLEAGWVAPGSLLDRTQILERSVPRLRNLLAGDRIRGLLDARADS